MPVIHTPFAFTLFPSLRSTFGAAKSAWNTIAEIIFSAWVIEGFDVKNM